LELDSMSAHIPRFAVSPDGSRVLIQHRVQRGLRGREERTELQLWQPGRRNSLRSLYANVEELPCGIAFLGNTGEIAECAVNVNANGFRFSRTRLDNRNRREFLHNWFSGLAGGITVEDFRADGENQIQILVTAPFVDLDGCPTCTIPRKVLLRSQAGSERLESIQVHAYLENPSVLASFGFGTESGHVVERRAGNFVY